MSDDPLAARLAAIREREQAATQGPWWSDQDERVYRLHGVHATIPPQMFPGTDEVMIPEHVMNHQILKAPKQGTSYAEYWPGEADDAFITHARSDVPRLVAAVEAVLELHVPVSDDPGFCGECGHSFPCWTRRKIERELTGEESR